ncbi:MAG TPA: AlkA N-terminal domain-containing protein, partial [Caulifigura sp.]|nr:AlkA N-terminal domain-containing protein [Caulifigura sp.]
MTLSGDICYRALTTRDRRFDGVFFVGVKSTGIYCRPVCTAKTPRRGHCLFFESAPLAERGGFRPCLRCRPELAPGYAPVDQNNSVARVVADRIEAGALNAEGRLDDLADSFGLSARQLRRIVRHELGVSPIELAQTNRLLLAKRLIAETNLPLTRIAFAAGFDSVRRFNALFRSHYRLTPGELRRSTAAPAATEMLRLILAYRPPFDWPALLTFLAARAIPGVECVCDDAYLRTIDLLGHRGWIRVSSAPDRPELAVELATELLPVLPAILVRLRRLFDLDARPDLIAEHLQRDAALAPLVERHPGLRVPGAFDPFELSLRAILGQQVSVRAASTLAGRLAGQFGEPIETPFPCLNRLTPTADAIAASPPNGLTAIGLPQSRAEAVRSFAVAIARRELDLESCPDLASVTARLLEQPGIGPWTAEYIAMRALHWPDAFPTGDLGLKKALQVTSARDVQQAAEQWRPWRA